MEELKSWVDNLTKAEKRAITVLGKARSGKSPSLHLQLFEWLCAAQEDEPLPQALKPNLPLHQMRLHDLAMDALRLLHQEEDVTMRIHLHLDRAAMWGQLHRPAMVERELDKAQSLAQLFSRHSLVLEVLARKRSISSIPPGMDPQKGMLQLHAAEQKALHQQATLSDLQHRLALLAVQAKQQFIPRKSEAMQQVEELTRAPLVGNLLRSEQVLERMLAQLIWAMGEVLQQRPVNALPQLRELLTFLGEHPEWQADQPGLLLQACQFYLRAIFKVGMPHAQFQEALALLPDFKGLNPATALEHRRILYQNQLVLALNRVQLDALPQIIAEVQHWILGEGGKLPLAKQMPFFHNFLSSLFLLGDFKGAQQWVRHILSLKGKDLRTDIQENALVMRSIILYERGDIGLNEYITRSGRRYFKKHERELPFEALVLRYLDKAMADPAGDRQVFQRLREELDELSQEGRTTIKPLGLNEIRFWLDARITQKPIRQVFEEYMRNYLEQMELR